MAKVNSKKVKGNHVSSPDSIVSGEATNSIVKKQQSGSAKTTYKKSIKEILGENHSPYEQDTLESYKTFLDGMTMVDLENHANSVGIPSNYDREILEKRLLREFNIKSSDYYANAVIQPMSKKKVSAEVLRIISEGR